MSAHLADRLDAVRHRWFVGREAEQLLFQTALAAEELPFYVLHVFGPGGIGKTSLLRKFITLCDQVAAEAVYIDGRSLRGSPGDFIAALKAAMGLNPEGDVFDALRARSRRHVLLLDTYEALSPLDNWLRDVFLPELPDNVFVVLAGRDSLSQEWREDPGWQALVRTLPLRNLSAEESRAYLTLRQVSSEQHAAVLDFTHGHPLALCLVADVSTQREDIRFQPEAVPDVIRALLETLVRKVPSPAHRAALEACALVHVTTEPLLAAMLASDASAERPWGSGQFTHTLFEWLLGLSLMEARSEGLSPHDLAREVLAADLRWRNPDWYSELHRRARAYYTARLEATTGEEQAQVLFDYIYLHRDNPVVRPFFEWQSGGLLTDVLREQDREALLAVVTRHEGEESAQLAAHWFARQPEGTVMFRDAQQEPAGFLSMVSLEQVSPKDLEVDPAVAAAWHYLERHAPLRPGERATLFRFWMATDTYQAVSPAQSLIFVNMILHYLTTPGLAFTFLPCAEPDFWAPVFAYADLERISGANFEVGGRRYGVYGHDWRAVPPTAWLAMLAERETATTPDVTSPPPADRLIVLSEPEFAAAVRDALRDFTQPHRLSDNPLLRSRLVVERAEPGAGIPDRIPVLQSLVREAAESLRASPRMMKLYRPLHHTYLEPEPTQEVAAEVLDLPISTFRRHLKAAIVEVTDVLWHWEIGDLEK